MYYNVSYAYSPSVWDMQIVDRAEAFIDSVEWSTKREVLSMWFFGLEKHVDTISDNSKALYVVQELLWYLQEVLAEEWVVIERSVLEKNASETSSDSLQVPIGTWWNDLFPDLDDNDRVAYEEEEPQEFFVEQSDELSDTEGVFISKDIQEFYYAFTDRVSSTTPISDLCTRYYKEIDAIAKEYNFPTSLIIATWFKEHTCIFKNPWNGRWNFQIISHTYPAGAITWDQFRQQVVNFIEFSWDKWNYYDSIQRFGPEPIRLTYTEMDLTSLRKHAIMYNGISANSTLEWNSYANQNFDGPVQWRDGIVAMTLRAIRYGIEIWTLEGIQEQTQWEELQENKAENSLEQKVEEEFIQAEDAVCDDTFTRDLQKWDEWPEVEAMQDFLAAQGFFTHDSTWKYGDITEQAVNAFQMYHKEMILDPAYYPWPTGNRYPATRRKANEILCLE